MNYRTANGETEDSVIQEKNNYKIKEEKNMVRWIAFILFFLFILPAFADKKKKTENIQELDEKTRLEFDYSFMEGVRSKITGDYQAAIGWFDNCLKILLYSDI